MILEFDFNLENVPKVASAPPTDHHDDGSLFSCFGIATNQIIPQIQAYRDYVSVTRPSHSGKVTSGTESCSPPSLLLV